VQVHGWTSPRGSRAVEYCCWALGAALLLFQLGSTLVAQHAYRSALAAFDGARAAGGEPAPETAPHPALSYAEPDQSLWAPARIRSYQQQRWSFASPPEAVVRIPRLGLEVPVFAGATDFNMTRGAGRLDSSPRFGDPGNVAVSSHRDGWFRKLKDIKIGDAIVVDTLTHTFHYVVEEIRITDPTDTTVLWPGTVPEVTLVTCYPFHFHGRAPQRFVVRAELREEEYP